MPTTLAELGQDMPTAPPQTGSLQLSLLGQMLEAHKQRMSPQFQWRLLDPGVTWGGRDRNAVQPDDYMNSRLYAQPPEGI